MRNLDNIVKQAKANNFRANKRLVIGVDVDNVLFRIPMIEYMNETCDEKYTYENLTDWDLKNFPERARNEMLAAFRVPSFMCKSKPYWGNYSTLRDWKVAGHRLFAITRRSFNLISPTETQFDIHYPGLFSDCIFVPDGESKADYLLDIGADVHIDDYDVLDSVESGIKTWLITNEETRYNWGLRENVGLNQAHSLAHVRIGKDEEKWK